MADKQIREWRGIDNVVYAKVISDTEEGIEFGEVKPLAGVSALSKTTASSRETHYYDNIPANVISSTGADEVTLTLSAIPMEVLAEVNGQFYDEATGMMVEGDAETSYFALGYRTQKDNDDEVLVWRFKGMFSIPDANHNTRNDGAEANGDEITYTGIQTTHKFAKTGKGAKSIVVDVALGKADVSTFFNEVTTPDTLKVKA